MPGEITNDLNKMAPIPEPRVRCASCLNVLKVAHTRDEGGGRTLREYRCLTCDKQLFVPFQSVDVLVDPI